METRVPSLTDLLSMTPESAGTVECMVGGAGLDLAARELAVQMLADDAMLLRCGRSPMLARWRTRRDGGPAAVGTAHSALATYAGIGFGLPGSPAVEDHLQGLVAELLWNRLIWERNVCPDGRRLVHAHSVKPDPLEPGGDGLVIYDTGDGTALMFRLWEIKKHTTSSPHSATINRASGQLRRRGTEYLAKLAGPETVEQGGALGDLYQQIIELWIDRSERAGTGVSLATGVEYGPVSRRAFQSLGTTFADFAGSGQLEGMIVTVPMYAEFALRVREIVWSGL
jgi:hypothetical protein